MVISIICLLICVVYASVSAFADDSNVKIGAIVLRAFLASLIFFAGKFVGVVIYYMVDPPRIMTILLRNLPGVIAFIVFVLLIRNSNKFILSRKSFILSVIGMAAIVFAEDILLMLFFRMIAIYLLG